MTLSTNGVDRQRDNALEHVSHMNEHMSLHVAILAELLATFRTLKRFLARMDPDMSSQGGAVNERFAADVARFSARY
ncbi:hypothetical protein DPMN_021531 [Dreissena polymorpha]|uniref:Uncharacterized protein n=1 Tax=Dreissena polymorpha TaxID=45954 RepID=A0A9D4SB34_DREPO|nr:hypothetical protein DPMN_021531 [Dreissena polymorpha]